MVRDEMTYTFEPFEPQIKPKPDTLALHIRNNLLRETLPYLQREENGTRTSSMLRALIAEITEVTKGTN